MVLPIDELDAGPCRVAVGGGTICYNCCGRQATLPCPGGLVYFVYLPSACSVVALARLAVGDCWWVAVVLYWPMCL
jgi:hypothetical protein